MRGSTGVPEYRSVGELECWSDGVRNRELVNWLIENSRWGAAKGRTFLGD